MCATRSRTAGHALALWLAAVSAACATMQAPRGFLPTRATIGQTARGAWAVVTTVGSSTQPPQNTQGELLSVNDGQVRVLTERGLVSVATGRLVRVRLQTFEPRTGSAALGLLLGTLSTASHGAYLIFSAPAWLLTGSVSIGAETRSAILEHPPEPLVRLGAFARFPQGYPPGLLEGELGLLDLQGEAGLGKKSLPERER